MTGSGVIRSFRKTGNSGLRSALTLVRPHAHARGLRIHTAGCVSCPYVLCERPPTKPAREGVQVSAMTQKIKEHACAACKGTGFPVVKQPVLATRKIYPAKCEACDGKGRITDAD
jgi:hypothetical protein